MATATASEKTHSNSSTSGTSAIQLATFHIGELMLGLEIEQVYEINRHLDITNVPGAPDTVRGVINLRGDVATVIDLRRVLGLASTELTRQSRNLIIHHGGEIIGLLVDRISDVLSIPVDSIGPTPVNVKGVDGKFFRGVHVLDSDIVVILNVDEALADG